MLQAPSKVRARARARVSRVRVGASHLRTHCSIVGKKGYYCPIVGNNENKLRGLLVLTNKEKAEGARRGRQNKQFKQLR